jgi:hypothetical protein
VDIDSIPANKPTCCPGGMERQNLTVEEYIAAWSNQRFDSKPNLDLGYLLQSSPLPIREDCKRSIRFSTDVAIMRVYLYPRYRTIGVHPRKLIFPQFVCSRQHSAVLPWSSYERRFTPSAYECMERTRVRTFSSDHSACGTLMHFAYCCLQIWRKKVVSIPSIRHVRADWYAHGPVVRSILS